MFVDGQIAMITAGRWPLATYEANGFRTVGVQYNPSFKTQANVYGTQGFMISSTTDHYDEACEFLVWTASEAFIKEFVKFGSSRCCVSGNTWHGNTGIPKKADPGGK